jgi:hypothetical protein
VRAGRNAALRDESPAGAANDQLAPFSFVQILRKE